MRRRWSLVETMGVVAMTSAFLTFAGGLSWRLRAHYSELASYADDLNRGTRQLDAISHEVRSARRSLSATPDGALAAGPGVMILERPGGELVVFRLRAPSRPGYSPRLERLSGRPGALRAEDLGPASSLSVTRQRNGIELELTLGLVARGGGAPAQLSTAARCRAGRIP